MGCCLCAVYLLLIVEMLTRNPLFPGANELDQLFCIHTIIGTPSNDLVLKLRGDRGVPAEFTFKETPPSGLEKLLPTASFECIELLNSMLMYDPEKRVDAKQVLCHPFLTMQPTPIASSSKASIKKETSTTLMSKMRLEPFEEIDKHLPTLPSKSNIPIPVRLKLMGGNPNFSAPTPRNYLKPALNKTYSTAVRPKNAAASTTSATPKMQSRTSTVKPKSIKTAEKKQLFVNTAVARKGDLLSTTIEANPLLEPMMDDEPHQKGWKKTELSRDTNQVLELIGCSEG